MNDNSHFRQLPAASAAQPEPQRLLFVFAFAELPDRATPEQRERFPSGPWRRARAADVRRQGSAGHP